MKINRRVEKKPFVVITGLSGSGKGTVLKAFEDIGFYCVDNLPIQLMTQFGEICSRPQSQITRAAVVVDVREGEGFKHFPRVFSELKKLGLDVQLVFLDATDNVLIRRYSETRRPHPLTSNTPIALALKEERKRLEPLRNLKGAFVIDTSRFNVHELRHYISIKFRSWEQALPLLVSVQSFGFKHGIPLESDLVFDARFLPNPNFVRSLKEHTGNDKEVIAYIKSFKQSDEFLRHLFDLLSFLVPQYITEGKSYLTISVGCTGGRHRSVMIANEVFRLLTSQGYKTKLTHRDIKR
jgi:RNase adapter protein RapZ